MINKSFMKYKHHDPKIHIVSESSPNSSKPEILKQRRIKNWKSVSSFAKKVEDAELDNKIELYK